jgi:uncharacterized Zn-binding protein involved in type VI secretion
MRAIAAGARMLALVCAAASISASHTPADAAPGARVGDATSKGTILPPGAPTVLICGVPAARVGDMAMSQTMVVVGAQRRLVRTNVAIVSGSPTVLIAGEPAARIGDVTSNGDKIIAGCPTVLVGT